MVWLCANGQREIAIGVLPVFRRDELLTGKLGHGSQDALIADAARTDLFFHHAGALLREVIVLRVVEEREGHGSPSV